MKLYLQIFLISFVFTSVGCSGSLSDDQRKALREEMEDREIKKVNENEIFRKALEIGQEVSSQLGSANSPTSDVRILKVGLKDSAALNETELKVLMAYTYAPDPTEVEDNIQKQDLDSLIYSSYILDQDSVGHVLFIKMARTTVVKSL